MKELKLYNLSQPIELGRNEIVHPWRNMALDALDVLVVAGLPARVIGVHDVAAVAEPALAGQLDAHHGQDHEDDDAQRDPPAAAGGENP